MSSGDDDLTLDDLDKVVPIIRWILTVVGLICVITIAVGGFKGWPWYITIPIGGALFLGTKIFKRMIDNTAEVTRVDLLDDEAKADGLDISETSFEEFSNLSDEDKNRINAISDAKTKIRNPAVNLPISSSLIVIITMFVAGGFWYGFGYLIRLLVNVFG
ncbi:MAG: hypothetical protein ABJ275_03385 [Maricaulaceae bacterium]